MSDEIEDTFEVPELGSALTETKQCAPGGFYWDSYFGRGWCM
jgi:hypothetical protein